MKIFIGLISVIGIVASAPAAEFFAPARALVLGTPIQQQYHTQDSYGQYAYGYSDGLSTKQEQKSFDGITRGSYSYVDANGKLQSVSYTADAANGFRVAATNLPQAPRALPEPQLQQVLPEPVSDTVEVVAARDAHFRAIEDAKVRVAIPVSVLADYSPKPVEDTPEVAQAKLEHFAAVKEAELRNKAIELRGVAEPIVASLPIPVARIAPAIAAPAFIQQSYRSAPLPGGFAYGYAINSPFVYDSRYFVQSPRFSY